MQRILAISGHWLHTLAFALWLGGILVIGAIVAPTAFHTDRQFAGQVVTHSFQKLNTLSFVCAAVMLGATWLEWRVRSQPARRLLYVRGVLTAAALALGLYLALRLVPSMLGLRSEGQKAAFDRLHQLSAMVTQAQAFLLALGAGLTAYLAIPRGGARGEAPTPQSDHRLATAPLAPDPSPLAPEKAKRP
jgi:cytochrome bd-type quinol oxidase subunit 2